MPTTVVFMGSPQFAVPVLIALVREYTILGVVTQPDRPAGRGRQLTPPPIKIAAEKLDLPVIQPRRLREPGAMEQLRQWNPEMIVVAAFGQILRPEILDLPKFGCINVHASLLPRWRGAAPIQAAIQHGDLVTGVTIMKMDPGIDTGNILSQKAIQIQPEDTGGTLSEHLAEAGAILLIDTLPGYLRGAILPTLQDESQATYAPMLSKANGLLDFNKPAADLARQVRALQPWPGTHMDWNGQTLKISKAAAVADYSAREVGTTLIYQGLPGVKTSWGILVLEEVQPAGKRSMNGKDFLHGSKGWAN